MAQRRFTLTAAIIAIVALALAIGYRPAFAQPTSRTGACHVLGLALTGSLTIPNCDEGGNLNSSVVLQQVVIVNTDSVTHTATVEDCQMTPFLLLPTVTLQPATTYFITANGIRMGGCFRWSASSTTVQGSVTAGQ